LIQPVIKIYLVFLFSLFYQFSFSQDNKLAFYIEETAVSGKKLDIYSYLDNMVPQSGPEICKSTWDFFHFRVTLQGKIDSVRYYGGLRKEVEKKIIANIYSTEGHWKISKENASESCWFIFPYFDFGGIFPESFQCTAADKAVQEVLFEYSFQLVKISHTLQGTQSILLKPSMNGGRLIKL